MLCNVEHTFFLLFRSQKQANELSSPSDPSLALTLTSLGSRGWFLSRHGVVEEQGASNASAGLASPALGSPPSRSDDGLSGHGSLRLAV